MGTIGSEWTCTIPTLLIACVFEILQFKFDGKDSMRSKMDMGMLVIPVQGAC